MKAKLKRTMLIGSVALLVGGAASGDDVEVNQKDKTFLPGEVTLTTEDTLVFHNDDRITHNMFSRTPGFEFNLMMQKPGEVKQQQFDEPGEVVVRCAIHPRMELKVKVVEGQPAAAPAPGAPADANASEDASE